jgi:hypothetical protein
MSSGRPPREGVAQGIGDCLDARQNAYDKYKAQSKSNEVLETADVLRKAARRLLVSIMGVED